MENRLGWSLAQNWAWHWEECWGLHLVKNLVKSLGPCLGMHWECCWVQHLDVCWALSWVESWVKNWEIHLVMNSENLMEPNLVMLLDHLLDHC